MTAENKHQAEATHQPGLRAQEKPAVLPTPVAPKTEERTPPKALHAVDAPKTVEGPTPVPTSVPVKPQVAVDTHVHKRNADHTPEHTEATKKQEESGVKPSDFVRTPENDKKVKETDSAHISIAPAKKEEKVDTAVKVAIENKETVESCGNSCTKEHQHHKRGATTSHPTATEVAAKIPVVPAVHVDSKDEKRPVANAPTTAKPISKREDVTTAAPHHLAPTSVHSSFSHTWTRPQANPAAEVHKEHEQVPAASDNKPVIAVIDPLKPVHDAKVPVSTTVAPSTTAAIGHRVRRGLDETEEQDQPKEPKPTKAWWRSLDLNKREDVKKAPESTSVAAKDQKKPIEPTPITVTKDKKVTQKRETNDKVEEKKPSGGVPVTSTQKPSRPSEQSQPEFDNTPPQFVHPVPVAQILGQKQA